MPNDYVFFCHCFICSCLFRLLFLFYLVVSFVLVLSCSEPASVPNSSRSQEPPYNYNTSLIYTCDLGHELSSGDAIRTCTASASWSGTAPTCSRRSRDQNAIIVYFPVSSLLYLVLELSDKVNIVRFSKSLKGNCSYLSLHDYIY